MTLTVIHPFKSFHLLGLGNLWLSWLKYYPYLENKNKSLHFGVGSESGSVNLLAFVDGLHGDYFPYCSKVFSTYFQTEAGFQMIQSLTDNWGH